MADLGEEAWSSELRTLVTFLQFIIHFLERIDREQDRQMQRDFYNSRSDRNEIPTSLGNIDKKLRNQPNKTDEKEGTFTYQFDNAEQAKLCKDAISKMGFEVKRHGNEVTFNKKDMDKILDKNPEPGELSLYKLFKDFGRIVKDDGKFAQLMDELNKAEQQATEYDLDRFQEYPATEEQIQFVAQAIATKESGKTTPESVIEDLGENPTVSDLQMQLDSIGIKITMEPDLTNYSIPEQRAQLGILQERGVLTEQDLTDLGQFPSRQQAKDVLERHSDAVMMLSSDEVKTRADEIRSHENGTAKNEQQQPAPGENSWKNELQGYIQQSYQECIDNNEVIGDGAVDFNKFADRLNARGIILGRANDGELLYKDSRAHHHQLRADSIDEKYSRNGGFKGQTPQKGIKETQQKMENITDQRDKSQERNDPEKNPDHGDAHGSENKSR